MSWKDVILSCLCRLPFSADCSAICVAVRMAFSVTGNATCRHIQIGMQLCFSLMLRVHLERFAIFQFKELSCVVEKRHAVAIETVLLRGSGRLHSSESRPNL